MKTVVCYKWVLDEADITLDSKTQEPNLKGVPFKISLYDLNAIEMAVSFSTANEGTCACLSVGTEAAISSRKDVLSRGPNSGYVVTGDRLENADAFVTSQVIAAKIKALGDIDLVFFGEGSGDEYSQEVGPRVAGILGWPLISYATEVSVEDGRLIAKKQVESGIEVVSAALPAVVTVAGEINRPRIPSMKDILGAGKKDFEASAVEDLGLSEDQLTPRIKIIKLKGSVPDRKRIVLEEKEAKVLAIEAIRHLMSDGVL